MTRALLIVDVQNDFCEGGALPVTGGAQVARDITQHLDTHSYDLIAVTQDWHVDPGIHFTEWPAHCVAGTPGASLHPDLKVNPTRRPTRLIRKGRYSAAYSAFDGNTLNGEPLLELLATYNPTDIDVAGLALDYCVRATALDAARLTYARVSLLTHLTASVDATAAPDVLDDLVLHGIQLL